VTPPGTADLALTFRNVHNWIMADQGTSISPRFPGPEAGWCARHCEHRARPDADTQSSTKPAVTEAYVKEIAQRAGFVFEASARSTPIGMARITRTAFGAATFLRRVAKTVQNDRQRSDDTEISQTHRLRQVNHENPCTRTGVGG
jgi:hypothetical protein